MYISVNENPFWIPPFDKYYPNGSAEASNPALNYKSHIHSFAKVKTHTGITFDLLGYFTLIGTNLCTTVHQFYRNHCELWEIFVWGIIRMRAVCVSTQQSLCDSICFWFRFDFSVAVDFECVKCFCVRWHTKQSVAASVGRMYVKLRFGVTESSQCVLSQLSLRFGVKALILGEWIQSQSSCLQVDGKRMQTEKE